MKPPPRLRLEPRASRLGGAAVITTCSSTSILLLLLPLPWVAIGIGTAIAIAVLVAGLRRCAGRGVAALLHVGIDGRITVTDRAGGSLTGSILDDSYVGTFLTTIVWCADGDRWWRPARAVLILPDSLPREDFRRLRVVLRYGRVAGAGGTSDVEAA